jgi:toxin ParE1/3/4
MIVTFSPEAQGDLLNIFLYLDARNPAAALAVTQRLRTRCSTLSQNARRGRLIGVREGLEVRRLVEHPFLIIYTIDAETVSVARILHGARDNHAILAEMFHLYDDR